MAIVDVSNGDQETKSVPPAGIIRFGVFEANLRECELRKNGIRLKVSEQPFQILAALLARPLEVISREEMRNLLWPGETFVDFDNSLNNAIKRLREVLGDSPENPRFIETVPKHGYRFIAPVQGPTAPARVIDQPNSIEPTAEIPSPPTGPKLDLLQNHKPPDARISLRIARLYFVVCFAVGFIVCALLYSLFLGKESSDHLTREVNSLVVLPLENLSGDKDQDYFADGMTDDLIANLAKIRSLRVIPHSTAMVYKGRHQPLSEIAHDLQVGAVVEGTVMRVGDKVRITAELVQVSTGRLLWADTYENRMDDVFELQNRVSSAIVEQIRINVTPEEKGRLASYRSVNPDAYENYLKGRFYWNKRSDENLNRAIGYLEQATKADSHFALAYAALADCYAIAGATIFDTLPPAEAGPKARAAALNALRLDPSLAEASTSLATANFNYDWDWSGASKEFEHAIQLNPSYATAYQRYSLYLIAMGRTENSLQQMNKARDLDPLSISINFSLGWRLYMARQYDLAIKQLRNTLDMDPSSELTHMVLGKVYEQKGEYAQAISELQKAAALSHDSPRTVTALARAYAVSGNHGEAERLLHLVLVDRTKHVSPYDVAVVYAALGNNEMALNWLEKAYTIRSNGLVFAKVEPELDSLRTDPRFVSIQQKLNFPD